MAGWAGRNSSMLAPQPASRHRRSSFMALLTRAGARPLQQIVLTSRSVYDRALVDKVLAGAREAVIALVDAHDEPMRCVAAAILPDAAHVPDVVQEAWIRVLGGLRAFEFRASLKTW